jgi:hypothetical protein
VKLLLAIALFIAALGTNLNHVESAYSPCTVPYTIYLPQVARQSMIIDRFGDTYATAYQLPRGNVVDDWAISRPPVIARVGGMNGAFDFYGSDNYPVQPMTIRKTFSMIGMGCIVAGSGTVTQLTSGPGVVGSSTHFLSEVSVGDTITYSDTQTRTVIAIYSDTSLYVDSAVSSNVIGVTYTITYNTPRNNGVEYVINNIHAATISQGEHKLWSIGRDGVHRWAYAKCTSLKTSEKFGDVYTNPATIEFYCREGIWYSENTTITSWTNATSGLSSPGVVVSTVGNYWSNVVFNITSSTGTMTRYVLTNVTTGDVVQWDGSAATSVQLALNTAAYSFTRGSVGHYGELTIGANQINWFRLAPGANTVTLAVTGSTAWAATLARNDMYL